MVKPILSLHLYSMRNLGPLDTQLLAAAKAGFRFVEPLEKHLREPAELKRSLSSCNLSSPSAHIGLSTLRAEPSRIVDACLQCEIGELFIRGLSASATRDTVDSWQRAGAELGSLAEDLKNDGIILGYHNNSAEFRILSTGLCGFEALFKAARGSPLVWQADIGWINRAGADPKEWLQRYAEILVSAHVKDQAPDGLNTDQDGWADVGSGILIWPSLWPVAVKHGARILVVEHDNPNQPLEFAQRSLAYLSRFLDHVNNRH